MHSKRTLFLKAFTSGIRRFFHARNIIIISDHKVGHVPLSGTMQVLLCVGILGFFSGASYIVGSYMTAKSAIHERDEKIAFSARENDRANGEMALLRQDLVRLSQSGSKLNDYNKFIVSQYDAGAAQPEGSAMNTAFSASSLVGQNSDKLLERISYLETRVNDVKDENTRLVTAIRERTDKKIGYFEDIIAMTGLNSDNLEHMAAVTGTNHAIHTPRSEEPAAGDSGDDSDGKASPQVHGENAGGPFIPYDEAMLNDADRELLENVDRLILLHDIVQQLPLSQPIEAAQSGSPFGKRLDPINGRWAMHPGIDLVGPIGARIYSASAGKIISADHRVAYGNMVDIDHGFGIVTRYAHMSKILVHEGETVRKGQLIGVEGSTGRSTGPHLHYEVRINDHPVNPAKFLKAGTYVLQN